MIDASTADTVYRPRTRKLECVRPVIVRKDDRTLRYRCRQCPPCLITRRRYWLLAAVHQVETATAKGCRTWFGTLTFDPYVQDELKERAFDNNLITDWGDVEGAEQRKLLIHEAVDELQRYWKRLRKAGLRFTYLVTIESGQSGKPHAHFLLHETDPEHPVRKRALDAGWGRGFAMSRLADGRNPHAAIHYVIKGLAEASDQRVLASQGYRPA